MKVHQNQILRLLPHLFQALTQFGEVTAATTAALIYEAGQKGRKLAK